MRFEQVRVERLGPVILDIPLLELGAGRTTAILGPNGAGKTTLLRLIAALEAPSGGRVLVEGVPLSGSRVARQQIALVFQEQVFLRGSVHSNLELGLRLRRIPRHERAQRIDAAADLLDLRELLDREADRLSTGEGRRVSIARAICLRAPLLLLDEPLAGLDAATYLRLLDELPRLILSSEATAVVVTHIRDEALRLAQDLVVLVDGRVRAAGDKRDVMTNPGDSQAAEILGFTVLAAGGDLIGVRASHLTPGPGRIEFTMIVDAVVDLVYAHEIVGRIGTTGVRVTLPQSAPVPSPGERILLHADGAVRLTSASSAPPSIRGAEGETRRSGLRPRRRARP